MPLDNPALLPSGVSFSPSSGLGFPASDHLSSFSKHSGTGHRQPLTMPDSPSPASKCPQIREAEKWGEKPPSARCPLLPPRQWSEPLPKPLPSNGGHLLTHHPPHLGRHVVAELPFDRGLARLAGHEGPGHLHARTEGRAARAASLGQKRGLGRPPGVQVRGPGFHSPRGEGLSLRDTQSRRSQA